MSTSTPARAAASTTVVNARTGATSRGGGYVERPLPPSIAPPPPQASSERLPQALLFDSSRMPSELKAELGTELAYLARLGVPFDSTVLHPLRSAGARDVAALAPMTGGERRAAARAWPMFVVDSVPYVRLPSGVTARLGEVFDAADEVATATAA